jgi:hypothetical protein
MDIQSAEKEAAEDDGRKNVWTVYTTVWTKDFV